MRKMFHFDSPSEAYHCDACVVWCFDQRFEIVYRKFLKRIQVLRADPVRIAGGAKSLASPAQDSERQVVLNQIEISRRLHGTERVILATHSDCGAYGGLERFGGDAEAEAAYHQRELQRAAEFLRAKFPSIRIDSFFVTFDGVWEVD